MKDKQKQYFAIILFVNYNIWNVPGIKFPTSGKVWHEVSPARYQRSKICNSLPQNMWRNQCKINIFFSISPTGNCRVFDLKSFARLTKEHMSIGRSTRATAGANGNYIPHIYLRVYYRKYGLSSLSYTDTQQGSFWISPLKITIMS